MSSVIEFPPFLTRIVSLLCLDHSLLSVVLLTIYTDEAIAHGATIQGGILSREKGLIDICLTLRIETISGVFTELVPVTPSLP